jgi:hypothetical protein
MDLRGQVVRLPGNCHHRCREIKLLSGNGLSFNTKFALIVVRVKLGNFAHQLHTCFTPICDGLKEPVLVLSKLDLSSNKLYKRLKTGILRGESKNRALRDSNPRPTD